MPQFPCSPGVALLCPSFTPALPPSSVASLQVTGHGDICTKCSGQGKKGEPVEAPGYHPPAIAGPGPPWGHISPCWPWGAVGKPRQGEHGGIWEPRGPRAGSALAAGAIYSRRCHVSDVCSGTGRRRGQPRLCLLWALSRCPHHVKGPWGPCPCPSPHRGAHRDPATCHQALGQSGYRHHPARGQSWAERGLCGGPQLPTDHSGQVLPRASPRE